MTSSSSVWGIEGAAAEDVEMGMWLFSGMGIVGSYLGDFMGEQVENNEEYGNQAERGLNQGYHQRTRRSNRQDNVEN